MMKKEIINRIIEVKRLHIISTLFLFVICFCLIGCNQLSSGITPNNTDTSILDDDSQPKPVVDQYPDLSPDGYITAIGTNLYTSAQDGSIIRLLGTNAGGWLLQEEWMCPVYISGNSQTEGGQYDAEKLLIDKFGEEKTDTFFDAYTSSWWTESDFENCAKLGMNVLRLPFGWRDLYNRDLSLRTEPFERLDWFVNTAKAYGIYTILDLHGAYGSQNGDHHSGVTSCELYGNQFNEAFNVNMWKLVAEHYREEKAVAGYDLLNEPTGTSGNTTRIQWNYYDVLYKALREVDSNHMIIMESCWEPTHLPKPELFGWENVAYEYHYYQFSDGDNLAKQILLVKDKEKMHEIADFGVPIFIGEFCFFNNMDSWRYALNVFRDMGYSWTTWTYKVWTDGNNNWGLYRRADRSQNLVTINCTEKEILEKWASCGTENFEENTQLTEFLKKYFKDKYPTQQE